MKKQELNDKLKSSLQEAIDQSIGVVEDCCIYPIEEIDKSDLIKLSKIKDSEVRKYILNSNVFKQMCGDIARSIIDDVVSELDVRLEQEEEEAENRRIEENEKREIEEEERAKESALSKANLTADQIKYLKKAGIIGI